MLPLIAFSVFLVLVAGATDSNVDLMKRTNSICLLAMACWVLLLAVLVAIKSK